MNKYTMDCYEIKREIVNLSKKISEGLNKSTSKFIMDMQYGLAKGGSSLVSNIARALDEEEKLIYTIQRLCDNMANIEQEEISTIKNNHLNILKKSFKEDNPIAIFDDSDIAKPYGKKFEDLDKVVDGSSEKKEIVSGYHVCEAVILGKNEKQPFSVYSEIYSSLSNSFKSMNKYTEESIDEVSNILERKFTGIFDRGYDDNKIIKKIDESCNDFIIRMKDNRIFLFKGKRKNAYDEAIKRKGKIRMELWFDHNEKKEVYASHTRVILPYNKKEYTLIFVYGLSEERPLILLTNRNIKSKEDLIKVVRLYFYRWRVEEYFRSKKQEYELENMRVRTIKAMNVLNLMIQIRMNHLSLLAEEMDKKLLFYKIIERSKSLRNKIIVWFNQTARGIKEILSFAHNGIKEYKKIEQRKLKQLFLF